MDAEILLWIQGHLRFDALTPVMLGVSFLGNGGWFWIALSVFFLLSKKYRMVGVAGLVACTLCGIVNNLILKNAFNRIRPYEAVRGLHLIGQNAWDPSFPSGHSGISFAVATEVFMLLPKRYGVPALLLAALIAFSRLYIGIHYPTDVLAGVLDGVLIGICSVKLAGMIWKSKGQKS